MTAVEAAGAAIAEMVEWGVEAHPSSRGRHLYSKNIGVLLDHGLGGGLVSIVPLEERAGLAVLLATVWHQERQ